MKKYWQDEDKDKPSIVSSEDKVVMKSFGMIHVRRYMVCCWFDFVLVVLQIAIRNLLLQVLDDSHGKIRTAVGMAVASIASCDWPDDWPNLMDVLLRYINDQNDINKGNAFEGSCLFLRFTTKSDGYIVFTQLTEL